ncbi:hypothetical protein PAUR_b0143 [Pseudoalteromonas aurantia 208]|uniref:Uncharacterized protein n=1 Tax=Pseudoalteromonas aurantia 208 TaxID=1314867 RepID=A0ABR9EGS6_9GAMM|nr:hypothetical protein [Pseudoalteromonas aurantia 208]
MDLFQQGWKVGSGKNSKLEYIKQGSAYQNGSVKMFNQS